jgi:hypothetical protein
MAPYKVQGASILKRIRVAKEGFFRLGVFSSFLAISLFNLLHVMGERFKTCCFVAPSLFTGFETHLCVHAFECWLLVRHCSYNFVCFFSFFKFSKTFSSFSILFR